MLGQNSDTYINIYIYMYIYIYIYNTHNTYIHIYDPKREINWILQE